MMDIARQALARLRAFFRKAPLDRDLEAEMAAHLAFAIEENLRRGLSPEEAQPPGAGALRRLSRSRRSSIAKRAACRRWTS